MYKLVQILALAVWSIQASSTQASRQLREPWDAKNCEIMSETAMYTCEADQGSTQCYWKNDISSEYIANNASGCGKKNHFRIRGLETEFPLLTEEEARLGDDCPQYTVHKKIFVVRNRVPVNPTLRCKDSNQSTEQYGSWDTYRGSYAIVDTTDSMNTERPFVIVVGCVHTQKEREDDTRRHKNKSRNYTLTEYKTISKWNRKVNMLSVAVYSKNGSSVAVEQGVSYVIDLRSDRLHHYHRKTWVLDLSNLCVKLNNGTTIECNVTVAQSNPQNITCNCTGFGLFGTNNTITIHKLHSSEVVWVFKGLLCVSSLFLLVTFIVLIKYRKSLPKDRTWIQIGASASFFLESFAQMLKYAAHQFAPMSSTLCEVSAFLSSYFIATTALWMLNEGILLFAKVYLVDRSQHRHTQRQRRVAALSVFAWAFPAILVLAIGLVAYEREEFLPMSTLYLFMREKSIEHDELSDYRKYNMCWTVKLNYVVIITALPLAMALSFNVVITISASVTVWRKNAADIAGTRAAKQKRTNVIATLRAVSVLLVALGTPYMVSLVMCMFRLNLQAVIAQLIISCTHGPLLFFVYCVRNTKLREAWKRSREKRQLQKDLAT